MTNFNGFIYTWEDGHLVGATGGGKAAAYVYNANGIRTMKVLNGKVTNYTLDGNNVDSETTGTTTTNYVYDSKGSPVYFTINNIAYYYERNLQGDITGIVDNAGNEVVKYSYNSWGKLLSITGTLASTIGEANHLRYRGYYYDTESGLYYLQSRYYNPEIGRFISKDDPAFTDGQTGVRANAYAYCLNNPVMRSDPSGYISFATWWVALVLDVIIFVIIPYIAGCLVGLRASAVFRWTGWWKQSLKSVSDWIAKGFYSLMENITYAIRGRVVHVAWKAATISRISDIVGAVITLSPGAIIATIVDAFDKDGWNGYITI